MTFNHRKEQRYQGVHLSVLFSPASGSTVNNLAESYLHATSHDVSVSGMSFDVSVFIEVGSVLVVAVPGDGDVTDVLKANVCWCRQIDDEHYRVGVVFDIEAGVSKSLEKVDFTPVLHGPGVPAEASLVCPACHALALFRYKGMQACPGVEDELPLYNCDACGTTRSIPSLLSFNRQLGKAGGG